MSVGPLFCPLGHYAVVVFGHASGDDVTRYRSHNGDMGNGTWSQKAASEESPSSAVVAATPNKRSGSDGERTDAEVRALRSANVRVRVLAGKEDRDAKAALRTTERKIPHGSKDEPYFAANYLHSKTVSGMPCPWHILGKTAGNHQAWVHFAASDPA